MNARDKELMQQVLKALEEVNTSPHLEDCYHAFDKEITALLERLAQPEQEPWMYRIWNDKDAQWRLTDDCSWPAEPIYTTPPKQEPRNFCPRCGKRTADLTVIHTCTPPEGGHQ